MAATSLRRAAAAPGWCAGVLRGRRAENQELFIHGAALAVRASDFLARRKYDGFKISVAAAAAIFKYWHRSSALPECGIIRTVLGFNQAPCALGFFCLTASRSGLSRAIGSRAVISNP